MCLLCVISRWSRRVVAMLPWVVIPFIIVWALSQLLPPGYRLEVTSPRLACVAVLLTSLVWYEIIMPWLSTWRARRSALLRERKLIEAQEAAKWRKEATRRCRNCFTVYKVQSLGGGRFMCTSCGHFSKRPVLEVPGALTGASNMATGTSSTKAHPGVRLINQDGIMYFRGAKGCTWFGEGTCMGDNWHFFAGVFLFVANVLSPIGRMLRFLFRLGQPLKADISKSFHRKNDDPDNLHASKAEKARKKADERRQARLQKELSEAEDRKQKEEVELLVEERRRLREKELEIKKESEREAAAEKEREIRRNRELDRRRRDKDKGRAVDPVVDKPTKEILEEATTKVEPHKEMDSKAFSPKTQVSKPADFVRSTRASLVAVHDQGTTSRGVGERYTKQGQQRYIGTFKSGPISTSNMDGSWRSKTDASRNSGKSMKTGASTASSGWSTPLIMSKVPSPSDSAWKRPPSNAWSKLTETPARDDTMTRTSMVAGNGQCPDQDKDGASAPLSNSGLTVKPPLAPVGVISAQSPIAPPSTHIDPLHQLFSSPSIFPPIDLSVDFQNQHQQKLLTDLQTSFFPEHTYFGTPAPVAYQPPDSLSKISTSSSLLKDSFQFPLHSSPPGLGTNLEQTNAPPLSFSKPLCNPNFAAAEANGPDSISSITACDSFIPDIPNPSFISSSCNSQELALPQMQAHEALQWDLPVLSMENTDNIGDEEARRHVWNASQLHDMKLSELSTWIPETLEQEVLHLPHLSTVQCLFDNEALLPNEGSLSPQKNGCHKLENDDLSGFPQVFGGKVLPDFAAFNTVHIWDDADSPQKVPPEFVDCITQEIMDEPVITADGHSYERAAIEKWLKYHDTSPKTGEVLPPPPGGTGVDKTLRPNHILRGQIIEYKEKLLKMSEPKAATWSKAKKSSDDFARSLETKSVLSF